MINWDNMCQGLFALGIDIIYPRVCPVCESIISRKQLCCDGCENKFQKVTEPRCKRCSKPIEDVEQEYCLDCKNKKLYFKKGYALWIYEGLCKKSVLRFKFENKKEYVKFYAKMLAKEYRKEIESIGIECFIPVPIHKKKENVRGYNQALLLAEELGKICEIPVISDVLYRKKFTKPQKELSKLQRNKNLIDAFSVNQEMLEKRILEKGIKKIMIVDDIYTTGNTIQICSRKLLEEGEKEVYFICLCIGKN